ncbi:MAG: response regulator transcription factor [Sphingomonadaceae bacterium]|uniref:response regulator transcription factor n=1 Tax=Thermaurantiacus sp. TaxID=2820283 RepID=UPI00298EDFC3|nr:response regulator transcription factor [Thermaurantiacus sp.]MCS6986184.1 response regulator transcription factor [Sphingomonadaceae bacterium]MDW8414590.1 response regulator transcription factor [Thermaurantiacus sp.]
MLDQPRAAPSGDERPGRPAGFARTSLSPDPTALPGPAAGRRTRLLLVEDDRLLAELLARRLEAAGHLVHLAQLAEDALALLDAHRFDAVIVDLTLPDLPGQAILRRLREAAHPPPVIILSGESALDVKLEGFRDGADDYVVKPVHPDELVARVAVALRRSQAAPSLEVRVGPLLLDLQGRKAFVADRPVPLTGKEFQCLAFLALKRGTTVTKEMFLAHLYGGRDEPEMKIIDVFICKIRRKLAEAGAPPLIETVWGRGYTIAEA